MRDSLSEPDFYGDLVFNYRRLVSKAVNPLYTDTRYNDRFIIGIKHGFSCINIRHVPWEELKTEAEGRGFQYLPRDLANANALKKHVRSLLLHTN